MTELEISVVPGDVVEARVQISDEELATRWRTTSDRDAVEQLVARHTRPVSYTHLTLPTNREV